MTRGNKRDTDRLRAEARNNASKSHSTLKDREGVAAIMRQKQEAAELRKKQVAPPLSPSLPPNLKLSAQHVPQKASDDQAQAERVASAREAAEAEILREQEAANEARRLAQQKQTRESEHRQLERPYSKDAPTPTASPNFPTSSLQQQQSPAFSPGAPPPGSLDSSAPRPDLSNVKPNANPPHPTALQELLDKEQGEVYAMMEIDIPREAVGKVIGSRGEHSHAQLDKLLSEGSSCAPGEAEGRSGSFEEYIMPLPPQEAARLGTREVARSRDGWMRLTIRGEPSAVSSAKARIEALTSRDDGGRPPLAPPSGARATPTRSQPLSSPSCGAPSLNETGEQLGPELCQVGAVHCDRKDREAKCGDGFKPPAPAEGGEGEGGARSAVMQLSLPISLMTQLTGKDGGAAVNKLRDESDVQIVTSKPGERSGTVLIIGSFGKVRASTEVVYRAFETILRLLRSSAPSGETLSRVSVEEVRLEVPASSVGKIIGTRGLVIKALKEQTGAQIALCKNLKQRDGPSTVTVRGSLR
ncbi:MAG: hypothetical protein SGPRY_003608, partial [Prymnesium sp.]